jgi:predicted PP-loop superfamily ATPase
MQGWSGLKACKSCTLNDRIFSVHINNDGVCNYCLGKENQKNEILQEEAADQQLAEAIGAHPDSPYQVLLAFSGGKDSTFTLIKLRERYKASVLALTFDNGFMTEQCRQNIHRVTARLDVDGITVKPAFSRLAKVFSLAAEQEIFPKKALERASSICTACIGIIKLTAYKEAILRKIPYICFGWTPGQVQIKSPIIRLDYRMILSYQKQIMDPVTRFLGDEFQKYFLDPEWLEAQKAYIPHLAYPLLFGKYDENEILETIGEAGWERPRDTDMNSTNCLLNSYANYVHIRDYGFNPYCMEIAGLVREGYMSREEGLIKLAGSGEDEMIRHVKKELDTYSLL